MRLNLRKLSCTHTYRAFLKADGQRRVADFGLRNAATLRSTTPAARAYVSLSKRINNIAAAVLCKDYALCTAVGAGRLLFCLLLTNTTTPSRFRDLDMIALYL